MDSGIWGISCNIFKLCFNKVWLYLMCFIYFSSVIQTFTILTDFCELCKGILLELWKLLTQREKWFVHKHLLYTQMCQLKCCSYLSPEAQIHFVIAQPKRLLSKSWDLVLTWLHYSIETFYFTIEVNTEGIICYFKTCTKVLFEFWYLIT